MAMGEVLRLRAQEHPDRIALLTGDVSLTYTELDQCSERLARGLRALGLQVGDRLAVLLPNDWTLMVAWLACAKGSYVMVPINTGFRAAEMQVICECSRPGVLITTPARTDARQVFGDAGVKVVLVGDSAGGDGWLEGLDGPALETKAAADTLVTMLFTSGSTGRPKGVVHDQFFWNSYADVGYAEPFAYGSDTRYLSVMPLFHVNGLGFGWSVLFRGGLLVQHERFSASRFWDWAREIDANGTFIIGSMANMLVSRRPTPQDRAHQLRLISTSALVAEKLHEFERRFGSVLLSCYGMTEGGGCTERPDRRRLGSSGVATSGTELRVTAEDGSVCPPGVAGRIEMRDLAGGLAVGYWDLDNGGIAEQIRGAGWFKTSDFGILDEDGFLFFEARERDRLRRSGENISAVEIENVLRSHPAIQEAAVVAVSDPVVGDEVKAFVQLTEPDAASLDEIVAYAADRLAKFKQPRYWEFVNDMPRTPTERVKKHELSRDVDGSVIDVRDGVRGG
jgi:crotonobetaine/carnitine-CoA ligase